MPFNRDSGCNAGFTEPIDFIVFDDRAWGLVDETSFAEIVYDDGRLGCGSAYALRPLPDRRRA